MGGLALRDLCVEHDGLQLVSEVSFAVGSGERVGLIGESGSGKSLTALAIMGLLADGLSARGSVVFDGEELLGASERRLCELRGERLAMIFQEPMTALNPTKRVGEQVGEALRIHRGLGRRAAERAAADLLARVELPDPAHHARRFPHELSGGQRQRVMMAMAISCDPDMILADEPTTALDVTVQRRVLDLLDRLVAEEGCGLLLITHDLAVVSEMCDRVVTMYGGRVAETGSTSDMLERPRHPYTEALVATSAAVALGGEAPRGELPSIAGSVPSAGSFPPGCPFRDRCARHGERCAEVPPMTEDGGHAVACWHPIVHDPAVGAQGGSLARPAAADEVAP